ncbi:MAG: hypothetical protein A3I44_00845 [Candidatus Sungbacteria bacterium RIFCSPLOWO2_02_FULL_51_17]|uniref:Uncharacterized protein n=1 Tax=Candidatus Sungbacteria bacterium RIFCSPHIGHO2_02_FULL_51_29 TaxID=1802273 RepID=A0A1G2KXM6_9BACT|nr:MAG: hypothetical protein A2676_05730 [Candidatus Sungbacteria bacterium RIFCSPHIGHO2_01_FULL_51_22]OHA03189.1 MAG: hypothetical protein A3C16_01870 [Candidatus Sungbacteria bacterium RIFCSPHIGHO2_02_FULL_51_29]OHA07890.1 MAG: hypothetical protein A3B29_01390 [Candidatus Sungbacteria bacterium RIFCSPLOWO2_01_FULL_51_34]OHA10668.1 MAG: hypothetical protein A3I44_00845 [Candidatus Sungbacteria bacterium RIFCSPLOWO2_02_FULL_51_17]
MEDTVNAIEEARARRLAWEQAEDARIAEEEEENEDADAEDDTDEELDRDEADESPSFGVADRSRKGPRISFVEGTLLLLAALAIDAAQFLLALVVVGVVFNGIIDIAAWLAFYLFFKAKGLSFGLSFKNMLKGGAGGIMKNPLAISTFAAMIEFIPFIGSLPAWTLAIVLSLGVEYAQWLASKALGKKLLSLLEGKKSVATAAN